MCSAVQRTRVITLGSPGVQGSYQSAPVSCRNELMLVFLSYSMTGWE